MPPREIPDAVRRRAEAEGDVGRAWLDGLDALVEGLATEWGLILGRTLSGGTEAMVAEAVMADGRKAVLKIAVPGQTTTQSELRVLMIAAGRGYAEVYRHDAGRRAMLLERLGAPLHEFGLPAGEQLEILCATLREAWAPMPEGEPFMTGAEKAESLAAFILEEWRGQGKPCPARTVEVACAFAEERRRAFDPDHAILGHGDGHAWNTLAVPESEPRRFKFVDPDGLFIERAYDLGNIMREWGAELLAGDPVAIGRARCRRLADLMGVDDQAIWQWGLIERTSSGLMLAKLGMKDEAREFIAIANAWAAAA